MSEIKNSGLDLYAAKAFEQQQFGTADIEGVKISTSSHDVLWCVRGVRSDEMEMIMADLDRANEVSFSTFAATVNDVLSDWRFT